jgi:RNA polymerase primary sigma factor
MDDLYFKHPILTRAQEQALARRMKRGDMAAREELILSNLKWAKTVALKFEKAGQQKGGFTLDEIFCLACEGLCRAADAFDPSKGVRFSTYSTFWMRMCICRAFDSNTLVHIPAHVVQQIRNDDHGRTVSDDPQAVESRRAGRAAKLRPSELNINVEHTGASLADPTCLDPLEILLQKEEEEQTTVGLSPHMKNLMATVLTDRERFVIWNGIIADPVMRLVDMGEILGVSKERARQIRNRGLEKLREALLEQQEVAA